MMPQNNVLIDDENHARLVDFGLWKFPDPLKKDMTTMVLPALRYTAPELLGTEILWSPRACPTHSSDVYSDRKSTRLNSSHSGESRMPSSA